LKLRKGELRPSSYKGVEYYLEKLCRKLHGMPVASIKRAHVAAVIQEIASDHGKISGRSARSALRRLWRWLIEAGVCEASPLVGTGDPAAGVKARERVLTLSEIKAVWAACEDLGAFGPLVRLLLMLGLRRCEIGGMAWAELDGDVLTIPAVRVKGARDHVLTLPPQAIAILNAMPKRGPYVFGQNGQSGFAAWSSAKLRLDVRIAEMTGKPMAKFGLHDLRRTMRSNLGKLGVRPDIAELVIGHRKEGIRAVYDVYDFAPEIAQALATWASFLIDIVEDRAPVVVPMPMHATG
jgi:integrase